MQEFLVFFRLGLDHITDVNGYDHLLFILTLCAFYNLSQWRNLLILVTAFTIGHSLTLALSVMNILVAPAEIIEFLIPVTIFLTAIYNIVARSKGDKKIYLNYFLALVFGLIHGMGFSNYLRALTDDAGELLGQLFAFNVGLEVGQLIIVVIFFAFYALLSVFTKILHREWKLFFSGAGAGISLILILEQLIG
ncbi:HupE/UreJ family protein [Membranihabitans marinus]|uniref:HupE/UreJ family protein n=1 Tax=Membranihabitans marinus TaxID=1227546 RepID=UPI001F2EEC8D|nr:HupE/UreJ family protein [Membranihabitans marinus]